MKMDATIFVVVFTAIFFVLGLLYKIVEDFQKNICQKLTKLQDLFYEHLICHGVKPRSNREKDANR